MNKFLIYIWKLFIITSIGLIITFFINKTFINRIIDVSKSQNIYFNPKFKQSIIDFKLQQEKKEISIIGTSRTAGFEKGMFKNQSVYNYSMITWSLKDVYNLIQELEFDANDTLIFGIDQWNFNKDYSHRLTNNFKKNNLNIPFLFFDEVKKFKGNVLIGDKAIDNYSGFRNDGSYFYGERLILTEEELLAMNIPLPPSRNPKDDNFEKNYNRILGSEIDHNQFEILKDILEYCKNENIMVFGFSPPFAPSVINKMKLKNYDYTFIDKSISEIKKLFIKYNFHFKDFTDFNLFDDSFYLDGSHSNRNVYYQILKELKIPTNFSFDNDFDINEEELKSLKNYFKMK
tara:strand:+ start:450 stop:1484 length:1035 start_codon:yes stop_codon:yes gene_type:complete